MVSGRDGGGNNGGGGGGGDLGTGDPDRTLSSPSFPFHYSFFYIVEKNRKCKSRVGIEKPAFYGYVGGSTLIRMAFGPFGRFTVWLFWLLFHPPILHLLVL